MIQTQKIFLYIFTFIFLCFLSMSEIFAVSSKLQEAYEFAYKNNITSMESIELFHPTRPMTRQEFAKMIYNTQSAIIPQDTSNPASCDIDF